MSNRTIRMMHKKQVEIERELWRKCKGNNCEVCKNWEIIKYIKMDGHKIGNCEIRHEDMKAGDCCEIWEQSPEV